MKSVLIALALAQWVSQGVLIKDEGVAKGYAKAINCIGPVSCDTDGFTATITPTGSSGLPSDPAACTAGQYVTDINASGTLTCAQVAYSQISGTPAAYTLPTASSVTLGGVKVGSGLSISSGTLSVAAAEAWHNVGAAGEPAFQNSFVAYGGGYPYVRFKKDQDGTVFVQGVTYGGDTSTGAKVIFTLPVGYRPSMAMIFQGMGCTNTICNANQQLRVEVDASGNVMLASGQGGLPTNNQWLTISGLTFPADQ